MTNKDALPHKEPRRYVMRLFVAGNATNSRIAHENLRNFQATLPECEFEIEIINLHTHPEMALQHGIFITPTLQILAPPPAA